MSDSIGDDTCFAGPSAGQNQDRAAQRLNGLALLRIQYT
jgi:hypothetical protein